MSGIAFIWYAHCHLSLHIFLIAVNRRGHIHGILSPVFMMVNHINKLRHTSYVDMHIIKTKVNISNLLSFTGLSILIAPSVLSNEHLQKIPLMYLDRGTILSRYTLWSVIWPSVLLHDNPPAYQMKAIPDTHRAQ
jgi:hypothetical protein